jgi:hypothetical protein
VWLRDRLRGRGIKVSLATLSYWRSGHRRPEGAASLEALAAIEELLELPPQTLTFRVGPSRRRGRVVSSADLDALLDDDRVAEDLRTALAELDLDEHPDSAVVEAVAYTIDVDQTGAQAQWRVRMRLRAARDRVTRYPLWFYATGEAEGLARVVEVNGGVATRLVHRPASGLVLQEITFDRAVDTGETAVIEMVVDVPSQSAPDPDFIAHVPRRTREVEVWIRFARSYPPAACELIRITPSGEELRVNADVSGLPTVHHAARDFGPGQVGLRWTWPEV